MRHHATHATERKKKEAAACVCTLIHTCTRRCPASSTRFFGERNILSAFFLLYIYFFLSSSIYIICRYVILTSSIIFFFCAQYIQIFLHFKFEISQLIDLSPRNSGNKILFSQRERFMVKPRESLYKYIFTVSCMIKTIKFDILQFPIRRYVYLYIADIRVYITVPDVSISAAVSI